MEKIIAGKKGERMKITIEYLDSEKEQVLRTLFRIELINAITLDENSEKIDYPNKITRNYNVFYIREMDRETERKR